MFPVCRAEESIPLDVQLVFGIPHLPMSSQRFTSSDRRLSLAMMTYVSSFIRTGSDKCSLDKSSLTAQLHRLNHVTLTKLKLIFPVFFVLFFSPRNPNPSRLWGESVLPHWPQVLSSEALPTYLELSHTLQRDQGVSQSSCSFWSQLGSRLTRVSGEFAQKPQMTDSAPLGAPSEHGQLV